VTIHSLSNFSRVVLRFFEDIDTPLSLGLYLRVKAGNWREAIAVSVSPNSYLDHDKYLRDASASAFLRKCQGLPTLADTRLPAIEKWRAGERDCYLTNQRLVRYLPEFSNSVDTDPRISDFLKSVKNILAGWLGTSPPDVLSGRFGPGATSSDVGSRTTVAHKMQSVPSITHGALGVLPYWARTSWGRNVSELHGEIEAVKGNRFLTVPKTALVDRCIAAEPSINVFYQLALGRIIRRRLQKATSIDLDRAQDLHRESARVASIDNSLATIDLSNASDTVARNLVKLLLPSQWFSALDSLRSPFTRIDGKTILLEKFSSMGNGYTFELETVIFLAIAAAVVKCHGISPLYGVNLSCFGDDIIVPVEVYPALVSVLSFLGFTTNPEKSFSESSHFRESCGGDYFRGHPVRPFYCKKIPNEPQDWIVVANGIRRVQKLLDPYGIEPPFRSWMHVLSYLPIAIRSCRGPSALGDLCVHDEEERWNWKRRDSIRYFRVYTPARWRYVSWRGFSPGTVLACAVYGTGGGSKGIIPRDSVLGYKLSWVPYS